MVFVFEFLCLCVFADTIPCMLSPWSEWSECSVTCGRGVRTRQRMLKSDPAECTEELEQTEKCMLPECPVDCMMSEWSEWSECNKSCGKGHTIRTRMIKLEPQFGGRPCPESIQRKKCKLRKCKKSCKRKPWTSWTDCTKPCGGGIQERSMMVKKRAKASLMESCKNLKEIRACNVHPC